LRPPAGSCGTLCDFEAVRVTERVCGFCVGGGEWVKVPLSKVAGVRVAGSLGRAPED